MKKIALLLCLLLVLGVLAGCGNTAKEPAETAQESAAATDAPETAAKKDVELTVFNWYDYIDPAAIELFEKETGIDVK